MGIGGSLVEQSVAAALTVAPGAYVLMRGSVVLEGATRKSSRPRPGEAEWEAS